MASIYKRGKMWYCCYMDNGIKVDKSLKTRDAVLAKYYKNDIENKLAKGENPIPDRTYSATKALEDFKSSRKGRVALKTAQTDDFRLETFINDEKIGNLTQITEARLKKHLDERINKGLSHRTANHTIRIVKTFLNWAVKVNLISKNLISHMKRYKIDQKEPRFLTHDEVKQLLNVASGTSIYVVVAIAIYTGMRQGEILRLEWQDIDFINKNIIVKISKSGYFRKIPLHSDLEEILIKFKEDSLIYKRKLKSLEIEFYKIKKNLSNVPYFRFHDLRHTFASLLIKAGVDIYTVSKLLGHANVSTTQMYSHLYQDHVQEAIGKLRI